MYFKYPGFKLVSAVRRLQEKKNERKKSPFLSQTVLLIQLLGGFIRMGSTVKVKATLSG